MKSRTSRSRHPSLWAPWGSIRTVAYSKDPLLAASNELIASSHDDSDSVGSIDRLVSHEKGVEYVAAARVNLTRAAPDSPPRGLQVSLAKG